MLLLAAALGGAGCAERGPAEPPGGIEPARTSTPEPAPPQSEAATPAERYLDGFFAAAELVGAAGEGIFTAGGTSEFNEALLAFEQAVDAYEALAPPPQVLEDHQQMVAGLRRAHGAAARITDGSTEAEDDAALTEFSARMDEVVTIRNRIQDTLLEQ